MAVDSGFDDFYAGTYRRVVGHVYAMIGRAGDAEDAVQEAYTRAWQRWSTLSGYANPEAWVRTVAYRIAVSNWRKATNRLVAHLRHGHPAVVSEIDPDHIGLAAALQKLSTDQRRVLVLRYIVGLTVEDIATETGVPVGTVKSRLARGRTALAADLGDTGTDTTDVRKATTDA